MSDLFKTEMDQFLGRGLAKSSQLADYAGILSGVEKRGKDVVDHESHLTAHPNTIQQGVDNYRNAVGSPTMAKRTPAGLAGISKKEVFALPRAGTPQKKDRFLIKPYHEQMGKGVSQWMQHPIMGWAEMANQGLWHAAGIGHMHQGVHVSEHNMGPGHEREPAVVIHMTPGTKYADKATAADFDSTMVPDLTKMGIMDFLTHNMDRHPQNLLVAPPLDESGGPRASRILAIDHGRNFQYKSSVKNLKKWIQDPVLGKIRIPDELLPNPNIDNLTNYLGGWGIRALDRFAETPVNHPANALPVISQWWPSVRDNVLREFDTHLDYIKSPSMREHLRENFHERAALLDHIAQNGHHFSGPSVQHADFDVPIHAYRK